MPSVCKLSIVDGMVLLSWGIVLDQNQSAFVVQGLKIEVLAQGFAVGALVLSPVRKLTQNQSGFAVWGLEMEVLTQDFALRTLVLPSVCKMSIIDGMVLLSRGMVLPKTSMVLLAGGSLKMEVLTQGFATRALVLPSVRKMSIIDGMVLLSQGMVLPKTSLVLLSGGSRWRFWNKVLLLELWFCLSLQVEHHRRHGFAFSRYGFDQNQSGFAVWGLEMEVLEQGFAFRALVLPQSAS